MLCVLAGNPGRGGSEPGYRPPSVGQLQITGSGSQFKTSRLVVGGGELVSASTSVVGDSSTLMQLARPQLEAGKPPAKAALALTPE